MTKKLLFFAFILFSVISCDDDKGEVPNEEEVITTLNYVLAPSDGGAAITLSFRDLDGDGGNAPVITGGTLATNKTYVGTLQLLNETETPAGNINEEIQEEKEDHQFFFQSTVPNIAVSYTDLDANGKPVGLLSTLVTGAAGSGNIKVTLRHEPNKTATGVSNGDITNAGGETDIEVTFPVNVQ